MKKNYFFALCSILVLSFSAFAQDAERYSSSRLDTLVTQLKRQTVDLVDRTSEDLRRNNSSTRADIEAPFLAVQLDASVGLLQNMIRDGRRATELRDANSILNDLSRRAPNYGSNNFLWRDVQNSINDISRELGGNNGGGNNGGGNNGGGTNPPTSSGGVFWRGKVDIETQLIVSRRNLETRVVSGPNWGGETYSFTSALPTRNVTVEVVKKKGRGNVRVLQQPNRDNDYTAVIQILDDGSGWKEYELEISWR